MSITPILRIDLPCDQGYPLYQSPLNEVAQLLEQHNLTHGKCILVTDENLYPLYGKQLRATLVESGWQPLLLKMPAGEKTKSLEQLGSIFDKVLAWGIDRKTPVLALGGGVIGDLAGFSAASLLRGLPLVQLPTTLVAQVDSALGGKTGINHAVGKNLIGAFYQPLFINADPLVFSTLPRREWTSGLAEVVKHGLIDDLELAHWLLTNWPAIVSAEQSIIPKLIQRAARVKVLVVSEDEKEAGRRAILNFGHTFGHAIEKIAGYGRYTHGEAVAIGMRAALFTSRQCFPHSDFSLAHKLVERLPIPGLLDDLEAHALLEAMYYDKKTVANQLRLVLLEEPGKAAVVNDITDDEILAAWHAVGAR